MVREPGYSKRAPRIELRRPAVVVNADGAENHVVVLDVSSGGFRIEITDDLRIGEFVRLRVEHSEEFQGQIRWVLGSEAGGVFLEPVEYRGLK